MGDFSDAIANHFGCPYVDAFSRLRFAIFGQSICPSGSSVH